MAMSGLDRDKRGSEDTEWPRETFLTVLRREGAGADQDVQGLVVVQHEQTTVLELGDELGGGTLTFDSVELRKAVEAA